MSREQQGLVEKWSKACRDVLCPLYRMYVQSPVCCANSAFWAVWAPLEEIVHGFSLHINSVFVRPARSAGQVFSCIAGCLSIQPHPVNQGPCVVGCKDSAGGAASAGAVWLMKGKEHELFPSVVGLLVSLCFQGGDSVANGVVAP